MAFNSSGYPQSGLRPGTRGVIDADIDVGLRQYMLKVYNFMAAGLGLTSFVAFMAVSTGLYQRIAGTPP
jgi:FtsH-binding integral membrane protein